MLAVLLGDPLVAAACAVRCDEALSPLPHGATDTHADADAAPPTSLHHHHDSGAPDVPSASDRTLRAASRARNGTLDDCCRRVAAWVPAEPDATRARSLVVHATPPAGAGSLRATPDGPAASPGDDPPRAHTPPPIVALRI